MLVIIPFGDFQNRIFLFVNGSQRQATIASCGRYVSVVPTSHQCVTPVTEPLPRLRDSIAQREFSTGAELCERGKDALPRT
jgi:hypothetical protein